MAALPRKKDASGALGADLLYAAPDFVSVVHFVDLFSLGRVVTFMGLVFQGHTVVAKSFPAFASVPDFYETDLDSEVSEIY